MGIQGHLNEFRKYARNVVKREMSESLELVFVWGM